MLKKIWSDPVWSKVISSVILAALSALAVYLLDWAPRLGGMASSAWTYMLSDVVLPRWGVAVLGLLALPTFVFAGALLWVNRPSQASTSRWTDYRTDRFFGLNWRWRYSGQRVDGIRSFCPHCDFELFPVDSSSYAAVPRFAFRCDSCGANLGEFEGDPRELESKVERSIHQKLRNGQWQDSVGSS
ncbi:hypothetical protein EWH21_13155 [Pseudomonas sp. REST10]|uniref:hypothetical protein n=1 Tax=Pseudomonas sp. REST10 TaxID=2512235 RepID=UPI00240E8223|nr:hypothetical protein [Pseudomonas sp. REST10]WFC62625.1 hypothetical protein EWH21_13155 [Pseudomonas sp. REST10]